MANETTTYRYYKLVDGAWEERENIVAKTRQEARDTAVHRAGNKLGGIWKVRLK
jgi:hypothetical protein